MNIKAFKQNLVSDLEKEIKNVASKSRIINNSDLENNFFQYPQHVKSPIAVELSVFLANQIGLEPLHTYKHEIYNHIIGVNSLNAERIVNWVMKKQYVRDYVHYKTLKNFGSLTSSGLICGLGGFMDIHKTKTTHSDSDHVSKFIGILNKQLHNFLLKEFRNSNRRNAKVKVEYSSSDFYFEKASCLSAYGKVFCVKNNISSISFVVSDSKKKKQHKGDNPTTDELLTSFMKMFSAMDCVSDVNKDQDVLIIRLKNHRETKQVEESKPSCPLQKLINEYENSSKDILDKIDALKKENDIIQTDLVHLKKTSELLNEFARKTDKK